MEAASYAARQHTGQTRKGERAEPYINHPLQVANLIANVGKVEDIDILISAILHDTVEDTGTTAADLTKMLGSGERCVLEVLTIKVFPRRNESACRSNILRTYPTKPNTSSWQTRSATSRTLQIRLRPTGMCEGGSNISSGLKTSSKGFVVRTNL